MTAKGHTTSRIRINIKDSGPRGIVKAEAHSPKLMENIMKGNGKTTIKTERGRRYTRTNWNILRESSRMTSKKEMVYSITKSMADWNAPGSKTNDKVSDISTSQMERFRPGSIEIMWKST